MSAIKQPSTVALKKNDIVALRKKSTVGGTDYAEGQRFVVTKSGTKKTELQMLNDDNSRKSNLISGDCSTVAYWFLPTGEKLAETKLNLKKGEFFIFKSDCNEEGFFFPAGTRLVVTKGGSRPVFDTFYRNADGLDLYLNPTNGFINTYLEKAEPVICDLTKDWTVKNLKMDKRNSAFFEADVYFKNKKVGHTLNSGCGECHRTYINSGEWKGLVTEASNIVVKLRAEHGEKIRKFVEIEDTVVNFLLLNNSGLDTLEHYLLSALSH